MSQSSSRSTWGTVSVFVFGLGALAFWVVGIGVGWRAWLLLDDSDPGRGIVAHAQAFGADASVWWVTASVLTLTTVVAAIGTSALHQLMSISSGGTRLPPVPASVGPASSADPEASVPGDLSGSDSGIDSSVDE